MSPSTIDPYTILVVDDEAAHRFFVAEVFDSPEYRVHQAGDAREAQRVLAEHPIEILLLDNDMPGVTGIALCRLLRQQTEYDLLPIMLLTGMNDSRTLEAGLQAGATDFIGKPYSIVELLARTRSLLSRQRAERALRRLHAQLQREREMVERLVNRLRHGLHSDDRGLDYLSTPVDRTSGDLVLSATGPEGQQYLMVGDFTGHGLPAAIGSPLVSYIFHQLAGSGKESGAILAELNRELVQRTPGDLFLAYCWVEVAPDRCHCRLFNGGMPPMVLITAAEEVRMVPSDDLPLGVLCPSEPAARVSVEWPLSGGESLFILSDGTVETASPGNELFGMDRLLPWLHKVHRGEATWPVVVAALARFRGDEEQRDDLTLVRLAW